MSPQGQPADVRKARNRPGLLAHGGGWAHFSWLTWRRAALAGQRSPAQLTSFCPAPLGHLGKPANGLRGREIQRSTSCNPRILQGRGMFDGKAFLLGEGFSRGGSLFSIIFKLWYKRTPLTGKPRHERPPLPPQICLGYVLKLAPGAYSSYDTAPAPVFKGLPSLLRKGVF